MDCFLLSRWWFLVWDAEGLIGIRQLFCTVAAVSVLGGLAPCNFPVEVSRYLSVGNFWKATAGRPKYCPCWRVWDRALVYWVRPTEQCYWATYGWGSLGRHAVTHPNQMLKANIALGCPVPEAGMPNVPVNQLLNPSGFHPGGEE